LLLRGGFTVLTSNPHPFNNRMLAGSLVLSPIDIDKAVKTDTHITEQTSWLASPVSKM